MSTKINSATNILLNDNEIFIDLLQYRHYLPSSKETSNISYKSADEVIIFCMWTHLTNLYKLVPSHHSLTRAQTGVFKSYCMAYKSDVSMIQASARPRTLSTFPKLSIHIIVVIVWLRPIWITQTIADKCFMKGPLWGLENSFHIPYCILIFIICIFHERYMNKGKPINLFKIHISKMSGSLKAGTHTYGCICWLSIQIFSLMEYTGSYSSTF